MSEENEVGHVQVKVSPKAVHNAVRQILSEMKLDKNEVLKDIQQKADKLIEEEVLKYLKGNAYGQAQLYERVRGAIEYRLRDVDNIVKEAVSQVVQSKISNEVVQVIEGIVTKGLEVRVGWSRKIKITAEERKDEKPQTG